MILRTLMNLRSKIFKSRQFQVLIRKYCCKKEKTSKNDFQVCTISEGMVDPSKPEPSVVIIGAGMAGLSAAQRLVQSGISNFTVLEATDRPGGRIHSCWLGDVIAEMGCQTINGACISNPVYNLAAQEGLFRNPVKRKDPLRGVFCTSDGRAVDNALATMTFHVFQQIQGEAASLFHMGCGRDHGSLYNFLGLRIQQELQKFPEEQRYDASRVMYGLTNILRFRLGDDLNQISADNYGASISMPGGNVGIPLGFVGVLSPLMKELPDCSLKFSKPVGLIRWGAVQSRNKGPRAVVQCCDGEEFCADYVIITVSLGVLKEHAEKMFCPALPGNKMDAIKCLGYGAVNKIFLDYERPFWVASEGDIKFAWSQDELAHRNDWTKGLGYVSEVEGSKHVLCVYISGPEAILMEHASDEEVAEGITKVLRQFTGDASLPYPSAILRSKWSSDPYFCGTWSCMNLKSNVGHQCDLSCPVPGSCEPVAPILLFAGEATCAGHHATIHGARLSGIREAERIIQLTKKYGGPPPKDCYGNIDKVFLDYERPFWVWSDEPIKFAWSQGELSHRNDWTKGLSTIEEVDGSKHVLCAYISGPEALLMEHASDEEVAEGITKILRKSTGDSSLPFPLSILRSKWASDPYFCGTYTYMNVNSNAGHQCDLSCPVPGSCEPVPPILLFAGEATCTGHHSTIHGARISGIREAERIIQLTKKYGGPPPKV